MHPFSESRFQQTPIVGILRGYSERQTLKIVEAYLDAGFTTIEITMNSPDAIQTIRKVVQQFGTQLNIGAGTVLSLEAVDKVIHAGGQFIVSPVVDIPLIQYCTAQHLPVFPGAYTPTEIYTAWKAGATMVKVFPASNLGPKYISDVLAPLEALKLMPTGGVTKENIPAYLQAGAKAFGMGGALFDKALILAEDWKGLTQHLRMIKDLVTQGLEGRKI